MKLIYKCTEHLKKLEQSLLGAFIFPGWQRCLISFESGVLHLGGTMMLGQDVFGRGQNPWSLVISLLNPLKPTGFFLHYPIPSGCSLGGNEDACPLHKHSKCPLAFFPVLPLTSWAEALLLHYQGFAMTQEQALSFLRSQVPGAQEFSQSCSAISFLL